MSNTASSAFGINPSGRGYAVDDVASADEALGIQYRPSKPVAPGPRGSTLTRILKTAMPAVAATSTPGVDAPAQEILLVEDHPVTQKLMSRLLEKWGHRVQVASDGRSAVALYNQRKTFDVILMDLQMPLMDGISATAAIRKIEAAAQLARTCIIAMTAQAMRGDREICIAAGMDNYLSKPVAAHALREILRWHARQPTAR